MSLNFEKSNGQLIESNSYNLSPEILIHTHWSLTFVTAVTNVSDQWVCINISGDKLYELLSMSCPFDFSKFKDTKGSTTQTIINHIDVIIHNLGDNNINLFVRRSFSNHLWDWLNDGANLL